MDNANVGTYARRILKDTEDQKYRRNQKYRRFSLTAEELLGKMRAVIEAEPLAKIDYVSMVDALTMQPVEKADRSVLVAMAVYIGKTRLIDNFSYEV